MDFEDLEYDNKAYLENKQIEVHSLTDDGFNKYISHLSHCYNFLPKKRLERNFPAIENNLDSAVTPNKNKTFLDKGIDDERKTEDYNVENLEKHADKNNKSKIEMNISIIKDDIKNGNKDIQTKYNANKENKLYEHQNQPVKSILNKNIDDNTNSNEGKILIKIKKTNNNYKIINDLDSKQKKFFNLNNKNLTLIKSENLNPQKKSSIIHNSNRNENNPKSWMNKKNDKTIFNHIRSISCVESDNGTESNNLNSISKVNRRLKSVNFSITTDKSYCYQKSNLDPLKRRLNFTSSDFFRTLKMDENSENISSSRFDRNYLKNLNLFLTSKSYFLMDKKIDTGEGNNNSNSKNYDGFPSYNIPDFRKIKSKIINISNGKNTEKVKHPILNMTKNLEKFCTKKESYDLAKYRETVANDIKDYYEENEKLKKIILLQTNNEFLKKNKLPDIKSIVNQHKMKIQTGNKFPFAQTRFLGGKYNPYNFQAERDPEAKRRNHYGGLFFH